MSQSCINVQAVVSGEASESHNLRENKLNYTREELSGKNKSLTPVKINDRLEEIKDKYFESVGQRLQKKATPIREAVVLIKNETTIDDLKQLGIKLHNEFGIKPIQIHSHYDEGHWNDESKWVPNLHAHIVFDWTHDNGKTIKLGKDDMRKMQDITADHLGMERGVQSGKKHLSSLEYKIEMKELELVALDKEMVEKKKNSISRLDRLVAYVHAEMPTRVPDVEKFKKELATHGEMIRDKMIELIEEKEKNEKKNTKIKQRGIKTTRDKEGYSRD